MRILTMLALMVIAFTHPAQADVRKDIPYGRDPLQKLDVYTPSQGCPQLGCPVLIYVHGGGWANGDKNMRRNHIGDAWAAAGAVVVSLDYRLSPKDMHPAHVEDIASGIAWTNKNISRMGGNPCQIFVMGHSAGAHLVALVGTDPQYLAAHGLNIATDIAGVMPVDTASYDLNANDISFVKRRIEDAFGTNPEVLKSASPLALVRQGQAHPPFLMAVVGQRNTALKQTQQLAAKLPNARVIVQNYQGMNDLQAHGQINRDIADMSSPMTKQFLRFMSLAQ